MRWAVGGRKSAKSAKLRPSKLDAQASVFDGRGCFFLFVPFAVGTAPPSSPPLPTNIQWILSIFLHFFNLCFVGASAHAAGAFFFLHKINLFVYKPFFLHI